MIFGLFAFFCLFCGLVCAVTLAITDNRTYLLPNEWVAAFAVFGLGFHFLTYWSYISPLNSFIGLLTGGGFLLALHIIAAKAGQEDALGLGDVKYMAAAGIWLGFSGILLAFSIGGICGLLHAFLIRHETKINEGSAPPITQIQVPAGVGFTFGIFAAGCYEFIYLRGLI